MWSWPWRKRIFVSYSSQDYDLAWAIVRLLRWGRGYVFFAPDSIPLTKTWPDELRRPIQKCKVFSRLGPHQKMVTR
jgi:hypothetical protein